MLRTSNLTILLTLVLIGCSQTSQPIPRTVPAPDDEDEIGIDAGVEPEEEEEDEEDPLDVPDAGPEEPPTVGPPVMMGDDPEFPEEEEEEEEEGEEETPPEEPSMFCTPATEVCNQIDDDCDGSVDEGNVCPAPPPVCNAGTASCDGNPLNGCETLITTTTNCGSCGNSCDIPNAVDICTAAGTCAFTQCELGHSNCDTSLVNGCEVAHSQSVNVCSNAVELVNGGFCADYEEGFGCPDKDIWEQVGGITGNRSRWYKVTLNECSNCDSDLEARIRLVVPDGINYNLFVYRGSCGGAPTYASQNQGFGVDEQLTVTVGEDYGDDNPTTVYIQVAFVDGATCGNYQLFVDRWVYD